MVTLLCVEVGVRILALELKLAKANHCRNDMMKGGRFLIVMLNDKEMSISKGSTLEQFLSMQSDYRDGETVLVNGEFVARENYIKTPLSEGDKISIIKFLAGG